MLQLVYISTSRATAIDDAMLRSILETSRRNNSAAGLTGLLLAGGKRFLQALEGPRDDVLATYDRIKADPRHFACVLLGQREIAAPEFGSWSMAYNRGRGVADGVALRQTVRELVAELPDPNLRAQFTGFAELHSQAA